ncbi:FISUMP domain-containing protein [Chryseobacterium wanjuense]
MNAIPNPAQGLIIYCTDCYAGNKGCLMVNDSPIPSTPEWGSLCSSNTGGQVAAFQILCSSASTSGIIYSGIAVNNITATIPYTAGNGTIVYTAADFNSSGVTGLTAHLDTGTLNNGNGNFVFNITGTAASTGNANFNISVAGKTCTFTIPISSGTPSVSTLNCGSAAFSATFTQLNAYTGTLTVPYTGGNGAPYPSQSLTPQNGLSFTLSSGTLNSGSGTLIYTVSGSPTTPGAMTIPVSFGGASCSVTANIAVQTSVVMCGSSSVWLTHNLGADTTVDSHTPTAVIHGAKYQWGMSSPAVTQAADQASATAITGWNSVAAANGSWSTTKTVNDPCPSGYRVPTRTEFQTLFSSSTKSVVGTWPASQTDYYGSAVIYECNGKKLTFPAAGYRHYQNGNLNQRGFEGDYWTVTESGSTAAYDFKFNQGSSNADATNFRQYAYSIRCISE